MLPSAGLWLHLLTHHVLHRLAAVPMRLWGMRCASRRKDTLQCKTCVSTAAARSVKKRNRHLATACAPRAVAPVRAVELLSQQYFFTSPKLAALATEAEILQKVRTLGMAAVLLERLSCQLPWLLPHCSAHQPAERWRLRKVTARDGLTCDKP
jgi:hypothetical protein